MSRVSATLRRGPHLTNEPKGTRDGSLGRSAARLPSARAGRAGPGSGRGLGCHRLSKLLLGYSEVYLPTIVDARPRLVVFVIAYYAESTLKWVLDRIPESIFADFDCEILVVDDASKDATFAIGAEYKKAHPNVAMTVLRNEHNQGYGGNQKVGYSYAIAQGFDYVALVHGDGQYAPEELPRLMAPLTAGQADAVFGSRMLEPMAALRGGMPLYKYVGNRILTTLQNSMLGSRLSEFHSGYRVYSVKALSKVPFRLNSNDFHFDTEIIIQMMNSGSRILELPIPTYYGDEICRV